jgi:uncharacterized membrane protein YfcA
MATTTPQRRLLLLLLISVAVLTATVEAKKQQKTKADLRPLSDANGYDVAAIVFMGLGLAAASSGGVGGGVIIVPILILVMGFDIKFATPSSNFIILGGAIANAIFNLQKRHPYADRPLVDADICMAMIPSMMGGAVIGAFLSKLLPSYVISTLLVLLMAFSGYRTMQKGIKLHKAEVAKKRKLQEEAAAERHSEETPSEELDTVAQPPLSPQARAPFHELKSPVITEVQLEVHDSTIYKDRDGMPLVKDREQELHTLLHAESKTNWKKHGLIVLCYLGILAATIGGAETKCGSAGYWVLLWAEIPWVLAFTCFFVVVMRREQLYKRALDFPKVAGDLEWTHRTVLLFPMACIFAGVVAGLFGVGGAIITGPLMIEMGVLPEVASSSSALLVLYSSAAASAKFALFNMIAYDWSGMLCGLAFVVTSIAQVYIGGYVRRTGRQSIIVFCIGSTVCIGNVLMVYSTVRTYIDDAGEPFHVQFCPPHDGH